jgi:WD40 repeat protein
LRFAKPRTLLYASGNCLNAVDLNNTKEYKSEGNNNNPPSEKSEGEIRVTGICHGEAHSKVLSGDEAITAFAMLGKENIIAYCERYSPCIKIVRWSPTTGVVSPIAKLSSNFNFLIVLATTSDISIVSLAFSADGLYLASLGDLPEHQVSVWDWRVQKLVASCSNGNPAKSISFNPADSKQLCTSGGVSGKISFWKIKVGFKKCSLIKTVGSNSFTSNSNTIVMNPWQTEASYEPEAADLGADPRDHLWIPDKNLLCISEKGDKIFKYRAENGSFELFYDAKDMSYQISSVLQNTKNVIIGCTDGMLRILNLQGDYLKSYKIGEEESIYSMEPSVDYQKLLVETGNGRYYLCDIRKQQSILVLDKLIS